MIPIVKSNGAEIPALGFGTWELRGETAVRRRARRPRRRLSAYRHGGDVRQRSAGRRGDPGTGHAARRDLHHDEGLGDRRRRRAVPAIGRGEPEAAQDRPDRPPPDSLAEQHGSDEAADLCPLRRQAAGLHAPHRHLELFGRQVEAGGRNSATSRSSPTRSSIIPGSTRARSSRRAPSTASRSPPTARSARRGASTIPSSSRSRAPKRKTPAQIVLRWQIQQPMNIAIPRSSKPERIVENIGIFDFSLTPRGNAGAFPGSARRRSELKLGAPVRRAAGRCSDPFATGDVVALASRRPAACAKPDRTRSCP